MARLRHSRGLRIGIGNANLRIETAARGSQRVGWNRAGVGGILLAKLRGRGLDAVQKLLIRRAKIRAARSRRIVAVISGGGGTRVKIFGFGEVLAKQRGADDLAVSRHKAPVRLVFEEHLAEARDDAWINE